MVETLLKCKETAPKFSSEKESSFNETTAERKERMDKFINDLKSLVKFPNDFIRANQNTRRKIAKESIIQIENKVFNDLKEDEDRKFNKEEKVCFYCFREENNEMMHLYLYCLLITNRDRLESLLKLNGKKETKLKSINNLFSRKETFKRGVSRGSIN